MFQEGVTKAILAQRSISTLLIIISTYKAGHLAVDLRATAS